MVRYGRSPFVSGLFPFTLPPTPTVSIVDGSLAGLSPPSHLNPSTLLSIVMCRHPPHRRPSPAEKVGAVAVAQDVRVGARPRRHPDSEVATGRGRGTEVPTYMCGCMCELGALSTLSGPWVSSHLRPGSGGSLVLVRPEGRNGDVRWHPVSTPVVETSEGYKLHSFRQLSQLPNGTIAWVVTARSKPSGRGEVGWCYEEPPTLPVTTECGVS